MHDIKAIRETPDEYDKLWAKRGLEPLSKKILDQDKLVRKAKQMAEEANAARKKASKEVGQAYARGDIEEAERLKAEIAGAQNVEDALGPQVDSETIALQELLAGLPNIPFADVPEGEDEEGNVELHKYLEPTKLGFEPKDHAALGEALGMMDFETAAKMSGSRFVVLSGLLSRLDRALAAFMLDLQTVENGYTEVSPPFLVKEQALMGTGQLPKFEEDLYSTAEREAAKQINFLTKKVYPALANAHKQMDKNNPLYAEMNDLRRQIHNIYDEYAGEGSYKERSEDKDTNKVVLNPADKGLFLIPTAEVSLTNIVRESIVDPDTLPRRMTAHTPCFRSEAGSAGRDTKGMIRQHQFNKVELVSIVKPEDSEAEHKRMLGCAEEVLKRLELPYRVVELCTGDLGFGARRTFDIEVWLPSQDTYREISSCSNCGDFQARRMNARYKFAEKDNRFVHTLNGSGLAVGRTLVAVLENYQNEDGSITVPKVLVPYMGGLEVISA